MLQREWGVGFWCAACDFDLDHSRAQENLYFVLSILLGKNTFPSTLPPPPQTWTHAELTETMLLFWTSPHPSLPVGDKLVPCLFFPPKLLIGHLWQSCAAAPGHILRCSVLWVAARGKHAGAGKSDQRRSDASHKNASPARTPAELPALLEILRDAKADKDGRNLTFLVNISILWTVFVILLLDLSSFAVWSSWSSALNQS